MCRVENAEPSPAPEAVLDQATLASRSTGRAGRAGARSLSLLYRLEMQPAMSRRNFGMEAARERAAGGRQALRMTKDLERDKSSVNAGGRPPDPNLCATARAVRTSPRLLGIFAPWRLQAYGYAFAISYATVFFLWYRAGVWIVDTHGLPLPGIDFNYWWLGGTLALRGDVTSMYDPVQFKHMMAALVGAGHAKDILDYYNWAYPPIIFLILAPLPLLPYVSAFLVWVVLQLVACAAVVFLIVPRAPTIALVLASPFAALDVRWAQTGLLKAALLGAALLTLKRRPLIAGIFIACLTYQPQFGILIPVALIAARQWRALASALVTAALLIGASIAAFGIEPWMVFPHGFFGNAHDVLLHGSRNMHWAYQQTIYSLVRSLDGSAALAWIAQGGAAVSSAVIVWAVWRSGARYPVKAALLSAATLLATPYAWMHDLTVVAVPIAFLALDQMRYGLLKGEQTILLTVFGVALMTVVGFGGGMLLGPLLVMALLTVILRRIVHNAWKPEPAGITP
jgi:Glycosyltransferase family 87